MRAVAFKGSIERLFDGHGENIQVVIGSGTFIPGFEDQLIGSPRRAAPEGFFPEELCRAELAGKDAEFETTAGVIEAPGVEN